MERLTEIQIQSCTSFYTSIFIDDNGDVYDVVLCHSKENNIPFESLEVVSIQHRCKIIPPQHYPWKIVDKFLPEIYELPIN